MSFGVGFGDAVAVLNIITNIRERLVEAPRQFSDIRNEVTTFSRVLQAVENPNLADNLDNEEKKELKILLDHSKGTLTRLEEFLNGCQELCENQKGLRKRLKRKWKQLNWDTSKLQEFRELILSCVTKMNVFLTDLNLKTTNQTLKAMISTTDFHLENRKHDVLKWLSTLDFATTQQDLSDKRQGGTGQWFLDSNAYKDWITAEDACTLFCPGIPGAGKTYISSIVVDDMSERYGTEPDIGLAFVYFNYKNQDALLAPDILRSLLRQLCTTQQVLPEQLRILYHKRSSRGTYPLLKEVETLLLSVIKIYKSVHIVIDAIDECSNKDMNRGSLMTRLSSLQEELDVKILLTSRHIPEIERRFETSVKLEIRATETDVRLFAEENILRTDQAFIYGYPERQRLIIDSIVQASDGMFLLARFHVDSIHDGIDWKSVQATLKDISAKKTEEEALSAAYSSALSRVDSQGRSRRALARRILGWTTCLARPMTIRELQIGLAVEEGQEKVDEDRVASTSTILSVCCGLTTVNQQNQTIQLAHYTTQSFFSGLGESWLAQANSDLAKTSLVYLRFQLPRTPLRSISVSPGKYGCRQCRGKSFTPCVFIPYAARYWYHHFRQNSEDETRQLAVDFLQDSVLLGRFAYHLGLYASVSTYASLTFSPRPMAFFICEEILLYPKGLLLTELRPGASGRFSDEVIVRKIPTCLPTTLHIVGYLNCFEIFDALDLSYEDEMYFQGKGFQTPLMWAAYNGSLETATKLIEHGANVNDEDMFGRTALHYAAVKCDTAIIDLLLCTGSAVDASTRNSLIAREPRRLWTDWLQDWSFTGQIGQSFYSEEVTLADVLLARGYTEGIHESDSYVHRIAKVQKDLSRRDSKLIAYISFDNNSNHSYLESRAGLSYRWPYDTGLKEFQVTPLEVAIRAQNQVAVSTLLLGGSNKDGTDPTRAPLKLAAEAQYWEIVPKLIGAGCNILGQNGSAEAPLPVLVQHFGHDSRLWNELEKIFVSNTKFTEQLKTCKALLLEIVQWVVAFGDNTDFDGLKFADHQCLDVRIFDDERKTALHHAAQSGDKACNIVKWLLERGAYVDALDLDGRTPIWTACESSGQWLNLIQILLDGGADIEVQDFRGETLLHAAAGGLYEGTIDVIDLLILNGVDPRTPDHEGQTPATKARLLDNHEYASSLVEEENRLRDVDWQP